MATTVGHSKSHDARAELFESLSATSLRWVRERISVGLPRLQVSPRPQALTLPPPTYFSYIHLQSAGHSVHRNVGSDNHWLWLALEAGWYGSQGAGGECSNREGKLQFLPSAPSIFILVWCHQWIIIIIINYYILLYIFLTLTLLVKWFILSDVWLTVHRNSVWIVLLFYCYDLPWLRFFRAFSSVVRQMPGYNSQRRGTARTIPN